MNTYLIKNGICITVMVGMLILALITESVLQSKTFAAVAIVFIAIASILFAQHKITTRKNKSTSN
jgi:hypothetical protein